MPAFFFVVLCFLILFWLQFFFFFQAEDGIRGHAQSRGLGDVYKRQMLSEVQNNDIKFKEIVYKGFHLINFITFLLIGLFFINAKEIIIILFSVKWLPSLMYFKLLLLTGFLYPLSSVLVLSLIHI
eukprot:TRINITY_DN29305_c0_g1_i1.p1 TRINITY_DN29305_c0_g1~~TRINITY_DN29305_c0_g1_i1.p1  ORF type:complete len:126 (+),score=12.52 TRINITY_DN29305_c0_g1_i1:70-447(+)